MLVASICASETIPQAANTAIIHGAAAANEPATLNTFTKLLYPLWAETGRFDVQANYEKKTPIIYLGGWEFETLIFDPTVTIGGAGGAPQHDDITIIVIQAT